MIPTLKTSRLILRRFSQDDVRVVQRLAGNFQVADTTLNIPHPYEDGMAENWISTHASGWDEKKSVNFAITLNSGELIGAMSLHFPFPSLAELGYWIGEPYWNQGYTTEAGREVLRYAFEEIGVHKVYSSFLERNPASGKVMQKLGMRQEGYFLEHIEKWGKWENVYQCGILEDEWLAIQSKCIKI